MTIEEAVRYSKFAAQDLATITSLAVGKRLTPYIGFIGYQNLGDEVLLAAHEALFPDLNLAVYRKEAIYIENLADSIHRPFEPVAILGGGTLINRQSHWIDRVEHLLDHGSKMFCLGTGVANPQFWGGGNEIGGHIFNRWVKSLNQFEYVGVRGPVSKDLLDQAGVKHAELIGDTALALAPDTMTPRPSRGVVGVCYGDVVDAKDNPMLGDAKRYRTELIKVIKSILATGTKVKLLPIRGEDLTSNRLMIREINNPNCTMTVAFEKYEDYVDQLRDCDIFLGQKLHSTIIALMNRVPSIMIEYRPKCRDFMASVGLEKYVMRTSEFDASDFLELYEDVQKHHQALRSQAESRILEYKAKQFAKAKELTQRLF